MSVYAVIDTNVLVSALLSQHDDAATVQVIQRIIMGQVIPVYSNVIMSEYRAVLNRRKFAFSENAIELLLSFFEKFGVLSLPEHLDIQLPDMKDLPFYEIVMDKREENAFLVTGNLKHFPRKSFIVTAREFLSILNSKLGQD